ncbi:MAG TPA: TolC family protein [Blastocatellia bacterium]|nr:TolC family protein [Blastocatellia bacterium]
MTNKGLRVIPGIIRRLTGLFAALLIAGISIGAMGADKAKPADALKKATSDLIKATNEYKTSVEALITIYEAEVKAATERLEKRKELFTQGLVAKRDLEAGEQEIKQAQANLDQARNQIVEADHLIAEAKAEEMERLKPTTPAISRRSGGYTASPAILRYGGGSGWTLARASQVQGYFTSQFGRQLPISAYGQTATHNRMRFNHSNSMDVAVHPDSNEGRALIAYLRSAGIPFLAFRSAVPGAATGAHIHIGYPSHRM